MRLIKSESTTGVLRPAVLRKGIKLLGGLKVASFQFKFTYDVQSQRITKTEVVTMGKKPAKKAEDMKKMSCKKCK